ncbi:MAG: ATP-binding protein [Calditrichaeota bacterium]|nr:MAG: ATP-binding protein [Calditrichota bacterium]
MKGRSQKMSPAPDELIITSDFANLPRVEQFVARVSRKAGLTEDQSDNMAIAVTELVNNAIIHGNKEDPSKHVIIRARYLVDRVVVSVIDEGEGFDPTELPDPTDPANLWRENGRGLFLVRQFIDEVEIHSSSQGTEIVLTEYLSS